MTGQPSTLRIRRTRSGAIDAPPSAPTRSPEKSVPLDVRVREHERPLRGDAGGHRDALLADQPQRTPRPTTARRRAPASCRSRARPTCGSCSRRARTAGRGAGGHRVAVSSPMLREMTAMRGVVVHRALRLRRSSRSSRRCTRRRSGSRSGSDWRRRPAPNARPSSETWSRLPASTPSGSSTPSPTTVTTGSRALEDARLLARAEPQVDRGRDRTRTQRARGSRPRT